MKTIKRIMTTLLAFAVGVLVMPALPFYIAYLAITDGDLD